MELFAPLHPPPLSPPESPPPSSPSLATPLSPPSDEVAVLVGFGGAFVKVLVGSGVSVWVAVAVGVSVAVAVTVAVAVGVSVTVGVAVAVAVLVSVGVLEAIIWLIVLAKAQAELTPINKTKTITAKSRLINNITIYSKDELSQNLWFDLTPFRAFGGMFIGAANAEQFILAEIGA